VIIQSAYLDDKDQFRNQTWVQNDIRNLSLDRHDAVVDFSSQSPSWNDPYTYVEIHYNNGVTAYNETWRSE
jgi:hypothetical protein